MSKQYNKKELEHHLNYEINALSASYEFIWTIEKLLDDKKASHKQKEHAKNIMIENFCLHARLLFEFFEKMKKDKNNAANFSKDYCGIEKDDKSQVSVLNKKLNNQIAHFMENRTDKEDDKISLGDVNKILDLIQKYLNKWKKSTFKEGYENMEFDILNPERCKLDISGREPKQTTNQVGSWELKSVNTKL